MSDYTQTDIGTGYNSSASINTENTKIETAVNSKVDKSGSTMTGELDMNSNKVINVPDGTNANDAVNYGQLVNRASFSASDVKQYDTVALWKADTSSIAGDIVVIKERADAKFDVISGTGTADTYGIVAHGSLGISIEVRTNKGSNIKHYGAEGDGSTSDTAVTDAAQAATGTNESLKIPYTSTSYLIGAVELDKAITLEGDGTFTLSGSNAGFEAKSNMSGFKMEGLTFVGEGVTTNSHRAFWNDGSTYTFTKAIFNGNNIKDMLQGLDIADHTESVIAFNHIDNSVGTGAGEGYGIVSGEAKRNVFIGNILTNNKRHALYNSSGEFNAFVGNVFHDHRNGESSGGTAAAFAVSRDFKGINSVGQVFAENTGPAIRIDSDSSATETGKVALIASSTFYHNDGADIQIGAGTPTATDNVEGISISGNNFYPVATRANGFISCTSGLGIAIEGNTFRAVNGTISGYTGIVLDTAATSADTYYDNISICNNSGQITSSGGATTFVSVGAKLCVGTTKIDIFNNSIESGDLISYATNPPTNPNIRTDDTTELSVTMGTGTVTQNIAGYNRFVLNGAAGAVTISDFTNHYEGKEIELRFLDANVTINRSSAVLAGGVNFTSSNRDIVRLKRIGSLWYETSRSVNN